jgi:pimeloyl-ACP methyl ester carboxylesterase
MSSSAPPQPPTGFSGWLGLRLFSALAPRLAKTAPSPPAVELAPWTPLAVPRRRGRGELAGYHFPAAAEPRGAVLLLHPWLPFGQSYFFRRGRITTLRAAGYDVFTVDLPGFGASGPRAGLLDADVEDVLDHLVTRVASRPLHLWGVSSGGYWAHPVLARRDMVAGAVFEDVSHHLLEWSRRTVPWSRPFYFVFRTFLGEPYRYLDLKRHAPHLRVRAVAYIGGEDDSGAWAVDTRELAAAAGGEVLIVPGAGHLGAIKVAPEEVVRVALATFAAAERSQ